MAIGVEALVDVGSDVGAVAPPHATSNMSAGNSSRGMSLSFIMVCQIIPD